MLQTYIKILTIHFLNNFNRKFNRVTEICGTLFFFMIYWYVLKALYVDAETVDGISLSMAVTSMLISIGLDYSFYKDKMHIQEKLKQGTLLVELMKPVNYHQRLFFEDIGDTAFFIVFRYIPVVLISLLFADLEKPKNLLHFMLFLVSLCLGYVISWGLDFICNEMAFFVFSVWGIVTIKNGIIDIFGGVLIPVWFLPGTLKNILKYTPVLSLYYIPINIYFGIYSGIKLLLAILYQIFWIVFLSVVLKIVWKKGLDKIFAEGI